MTATTERKEQKLTATTPVGTFTRRTPRTYLFVSVSGPMQMAQLERRQREERVSITKYRDEYATVAASGVSGVTYATADDFAKWAADYTAKLDAMPAVHAAERSERAEQLANAEAGNPAGFVLHSWHQSERAAAAAVRKLNADGWTRVAVYPVDAK